MSTISQITAEELAQLPRGRVRYELLNGELRVMPLAGARHGAVAMNVGGNLFRFVHQHKLGHVFAAETGFRLESNPDTVRAADVSFVSLQRLPTIPDAPAFLCMAPDLAIEVLSPSDRETEWKEKSAQWLEAGARAVVIVDSAARTVQILTVQATPIILTEVDVLQLPAIVPRWEMPIREMFE